MPSNPTSPSNTTLAALRSGFVRNIVEPCRRFLSADEPANFTAVKEAELEEINKSRRSREQDPVNNDLVGLACSGGGIRSATFNLGIFQGLAERGWLRQIDYTSTISGGGYIGSWLVAWIRRVGSFAVEERLKANSQPPPPDEPDRYLEPDQVRFLRKYSNYLTPWMGLLGADTWTVVAIYLRNLLLNLVVLIAFGICLLLLPDIGLWVFQSNLVPGPLILEWIIGLSLTLLMLVIGMGFGALSSDSPARQDWRRLVIGNAGVLTSWSTLFASVCGMLLLGYWRAGLGGLRPGHWIPLTSMLYLGLWLVSVIGWRWCRAGANPDPIEQRRWFRWTFLVATTLLIGALLGFTIFQTGRLFAGLNPYGAGPAVLCAGRVALIVFGPPLLILSTMIAAVFHMGLSGRSMPDAQREWLARAGAITFLLALFWLVGFSASFYGPLLVKFLVSSQWATEQWGRFFKWLIGLGWVSTTAAGLLAGRSASTNGINNGKFSIITRVAPPVFVIGLVLLLSFALDGALIRLSGTITAPSMTEHQQRIAAEKLTVQVKASSDQLMNASNLKAQSQAVQQLDRIWVQGASFHDLAVRHWSGLGNYAQSRPGESLWRRVSSSCIWRLLAIGLLLLFIFGNRVDINEFSLHLFYRNRLTRAYLGASVTDRHPDPFTGFSAQDDRQLQDLIVDCKQPRCPIDRKPSANPLEGYDGPYPIFGTALNLVRGKELAWQNRKASSFVFTPLFCGYDYFSDSSQPVKRNYMRAAYRPTKDYTRKGGPRLGTAVAISGAAASPNMGYHTSPALAFLMTVFNVRLGAWFANPRHSTLWRRRTGPALGLLYLLRELFPLTSDDMHYVYLSDGGHFENLGLYELVRRQCRYIVAGDGSCDERMTFQDLGNAIDKCRRDFGVEIDIKLDRLVLNEKSHTTAHFAFGTITYPNTTNVGYLLYVKPSLVGDEPSDVIAYCKQHPHFPHDTTTNQFFTESQFESYRKLGQQIFRLIVTAATLPGTGGNPVEPASLKGLFENLRQGATTPSWTEIAPPYDQHLRISYR